NTEGTINIVNQSLKAGVKHFIFISSIGAVATLSTSFLNENTPCFPNTPYGQSKLEAERGLIQLANNSLMDWTILRPTLVYGDGNPGNMERLFKLIQIGIPLPLDGIKNHRSFLYIENLVNAIITCITHPKARNQIFHISDGQDLSTSDLIRKIAYHAGYPCRIFYCPLPILHGLGYCGDILELLSNRSLPLNQKTIQKLTHSLRVDSNHIRQTLDWHPPFTVDEGIAQTFSHSSL
ncbi:MAG: NAD-dependent epimerase/dehydratase family protein, partial [Planktothrix sp.]